MALKGGEVLSRAGRLRVVPLALAFAAVAGVLVLAPLPPVAPPAAAGDGPAGPSAAGADVPVPTELLTSRWWASDEVTRWRLAPPGVRPSPDVRVQDVSSLPALSAASSRAAQTRRVHVVLGRSPSDGGRDETTRADLVKVVADVNRFFAQVAPAKVKFKLASVSPWTSVPAPGCSVQAAAAAARALGLPASGRDHVLLYQTGCPGAGFAELFGNLVFVNGGMSSEVFAHELGHNLGLGHSNYATCSTLFEASPCSIKRERAQEVEYGDFSDVMGGYAYFDGAPKATSVPVRSGLGPLHLRQLGVKVKTVTVDPAALTGPKTVVLSERTARSGTKAVQVKWAGKTVTLSLMGPASQPPGLGLGSRDGFPASVLIAQAPSGFFTYVHSFNVFPAPPDLNPFSAPLGAGLLAGFTVPLGDTGAQLVVRQLSASSATLEFRPKDRRDFESVSVAVVGDDARVSWSLPNRSEVVAQSVTGFQLGGPFPVAAPVTVVDPSASSVTVPRTAWYPTDWRFLVEVTYADGSKRSALTRPVAAVR